MYGGSLETIDPRISTLPRQSTSDFRRLGCDAHNGVCAFYCEPVVCCHFVPVGARRQHVLKLNAARGINRVVSGGRRVCLRRLRRERNFRDFNTKVTHKIVV